MSNWWNKILMGDIDQKCKSGYMIIGPNCSDFTLSTWYCDSEEQAIRMATQWSGNYGGCYEIIKYELCGVIRPTILPTEYRKPLTPIANKADEKDF